MTVTAPERADRVPGQDGTGPGPARRPVPDWRRWRAPAAVVLVVLLGGLIVALLQVPAPVTGPLDPDDTGLAGAHALVALLRDRGQTVLRAGSAASATASARAPGTTLVLTSPRLLSAGDLAALARLRASLLLVAPGRAALAALAPEVTLARPVLVRDLPPRCGLPGAVAAGDAALGGLLLRSTAPGAWRCYPEGAATPSLLASLVRYDSRGRLITVLGTGAPLANSGLGRYGNAALALNLLASRPRIVWLVPGPLPAPGAAGPGHRPLASLIPGQVYAVAIQLGVVVVLLALWRMRRLGPLVTEPLPVVVRACETVEGHGRLYRSRRARDRAAAALREAALGRIVTRLGLPRDVPADAVGQELARRTGRDPGEIRALLFGEVPGDDAALVRLADGLDALEGQVLIL
jgi:Domain of unknown function (DUF4350)